MNRYLKGVAYLAMTKPGKIPAIYRLLTGAKRFARRSFMNDSGESAPPVTISIRPTYRCNLRCIQCGQWGERGALKDAGKELLEKELTTEQIRSFIDQVSRFRPYISFTGGEPLLRKDIFELIKFTNSRSLLVSMNSNCTLLEKNAEETVKSGLDYLFGSLDGPPGIDDTIRRGEKSSENAVRGIKALLESRKRHKTRLPLIQMQFTLTCENQYAIWDTAEFAEKELMVDTFGIVPGVFTTELLNEETAHIYKKEFGIDQKYWRGFIRDVSGMD
jgi:MoaA/NifB/PqqE/SkfB family radical SAM enzyme